MSLSGIVAGARPALLYGQVTLSLSGFIATLTGARPALLCDRAVALRHRRYFAGTRLALLYGQVALSLSGIVTGARPALLYGQVTLSLSGLSPRLLALGLLCSAVPALQSGLQHHVCGSDNALL
jgi:hypothetical protein